MYFLTAFLRNGLCPHIDNDPEIQSANTKDLLNKQVNMERSSCYRPSGRLSRSRVEFIPLLTKYFAVHFRNFLGTQTLFKSCESHFI